MAATTAEGLATMATAVEAITGAAAEATTAATGKGMAAAMAAATETVMVAAMGTVTAVAMEVDTEAPDTATVVSDLVVICFFLNLKRSCQID